MEAGNRMESKNEVWRRKKKKKMMMMMMREGFYMVLERSFLLFYFLLSFSSFLSVTSSFSCLHLFRFLLIIHQTDQPFSFFLFFLSFFVTIRSYPSSFLDLFFQGVFVVLSSSLLLASLADSARPPSNRAETLFIPLLSVLLSHHFSSPFSLLIFHSFRMRSLSFRLRSCLHLGHSLFCSPFSLPISPSFRAFLSSSRLRSCLYRWHALLALQKTERKRINHSNMRRKKAV